MTVLIAGAGPTGLTLAIELARRDIAVRVIDKADEFFQGSRGDGLQPRTLEVFEDLGVLDQVLVQGIPSPLLKILIGGQPAGQRRMGELVDPTPDRPYPNGHMLGQSRTEAILRDRLSDFGVSVELSTALVSFSQDDSRVIAELSTGETIEVDYLVGADGGKSVVRKQLGIAFEGSTDDSFRMLLGDVSAEGLDHEYGYWFAGPDNPMEGIVMTPLSGGDQFQFGAPLGERDLEPSLETLQGLVDKYAGEGVAKLRDLTWSTVWRPNIRLAERFRVGRVFIAGDAAHVHPPTGGQGLNTGVQDAYNLGWKLADGREEVLATYESERRTNAARVLGLSEGLMQKHLDGDESALDRGEDTRQLAISYRALDATDPLTTGDRAPDSRLLDASGNQVRLFDLFRGPHETLLRFNPSTPTDHPHAVTITHEPKPGGIDREAKPGLYTSPEAFSYYYAADGDEVLIRPDGYIG